MLGVRGTILFHQNEEEENTQKKITKQKFLIAVRVQGVLSRSIRCVGWDEIEVHNNQKKQSI